MCGRKDTFIKLTLTGQFWRRDDMDALERHFRSSSATYRPLYILDLARLTFINSQALGLLVKLHSLCEEADGKLILYLPRSTVRDVIEVTGLAAFVAIADSEEELKKLMQPAGEKKYR